MHTEMYNTRKHDSDNTQPCHASVHTQATDVTTSMYVRDWGRMYASVWVKVAIETTLITRYVYMCACGCARCSTGINSMILFDAVDRNRRARAFHGAFCRKYVDCINGLRRLLQQQQQCQCKRQRQKCSRDWVIRLFVRLQEYIEWYLAHGALRFHPFGCVLWNLQFRTG